MANNNYIYQNYSAEVFQGFYNSSYYDDNTLEYFESGSTKPEGYSWEFKHGDGWNKFQIRMAEAWVDKIGDCFYDNPLNLEFVKLVEINSPQYYNYRTDRILVEVKVDFGKLQEYCFNTCKEDFGKYLNENWKSRSGFVSFVPDTVKAFEEKYVKDKDLKNVLVEYYLLKHVDFDKLTYCILEEQYEILDGLVLLEDSNGNQYEYDWDDDNDCYKVAEMVWQNPRASL